jgi:hypothetical protein
MNKSLNISIFLSKIKCKTSKAKCQVLNFKPQLSNFVYLYKVHQLLTHSLNEMAGQARHDESVL